jgi:hypothetical protein
MGASGQTPIARMTGMTRWWARSGSMRAKNVRKMKGYIATSLGRRAPHRIRAAGLLGARAVIGAQLRDGCLEVLERVERLVHAREAQVGDLVEVAQRAEDREPDLVGVDLRRPVWRTASSTACASTPGRPRSPGAPGRLCARPT